MTKKGRDGSLQFWSSIVFGKCDGCAADIVCKNNCVCEHQMIATRNSDEDDRWGSYAASCGEIFPSSWR